MCAIGTSNIWLLEKKKGMVGDMKLLAIDSSGLVASVALIEEEQMIALYSVNYKKTHSQTLMPMLNEICQAVDLDLNTIDAIAISKGPGSFTGLRIGSATVKGLALALQKPVVEVLTVDGLAYSLFGNTKIICPIMDARREQVYTGLYTFSDEDGSSKFNILKEQTATGILDIISEINKIGKPVIFLGDAVVVYQQIIMDAIQVPFEFAPSFCNRQNAGAIGALGMQYFKQGKVVLAKDHEPEYLRLSQAERERKEKENELAKVK